MLKCIKVLQQIAKMKKLVFILAILFTGTFVIAQEKINPSTTITITGKVKHDVVYSISNLDTFSQVTLEDVVIKNHKGEVKKTIHQPKGILLKELLKKVEFGVDGPKELNKLYFVLTATDGFKAVFSFNEIYNSILGDKIIIITEADGVKLEAMSDRILFVSAGDINTGRRHIKCLEKIEVKLAD